MGPRHSHGRAATAPLGVGRCVTQLASLQPAVGRAETAALTDGMVPHDEPHQGGVTRGGSETMRCSGDYITSLSSLQERERQKDAKDRATEDGEEILH